jgi:hypothetical protein
MTDSSDNEEGLQSEEASRVAALITRYICASIKPVEQEKLDDWISDNDKNMLLFEELTDPNNMLSDMSWMDATKTRHSLKRIRQRLNFSGSIRSVRLFNKWWHYVAAASFLFIAGTAGYYIYRTPGEPPPPVALAEKKDIAPGGNKATLTLANGNTIFLEETRDGMLATQGNGHVTKDKGSLKYEAEGGQTSPLHSLYNTLNTPRGGTYALTLSDGSKAWLNAASSIRFPAVFSGNSRLVTITGEVYFEVMKNKASPFRVQVNGMEIEVLGTEFNVNAYAGENGIQTTLLTGSVKLINNTKINFLKPGQQARMYGTGNTQVTNDADTEQVMAWKNGLFQFTQADLPTVMRQISRWYDIDVIYEGQPPLIMTTGKAPRNISLANLLKILSLNGVHYRIEGKKLIILP